MNEIHAVIGANYGDEGKGKFVNYLSRKTKKPIVIKANGSAQAGHTVVIDGQRIVNHQLGSGMQCPTYLASTFLFNPFVLKNEINERILFENNIKQKVSYELLVDSACRVVTIWDMMENQKCQTNLSHGSCGMGVFKAIRRHESVPFFAYELHLGEDYLRQKFLSIMEFYDVRETERSYMIDYSFMLLKEIENDYDIAEESWVEEYSTAIFENGQGLRLCQSNFKDFPNLTPSFTGLQNVRLFDEKYIATINAYYITRPYITRHGNGPIENEFDNLITFDDPTNIENPFQGKLRFAELDINEMNNFIQRDIAHLRDKKEFTLVVNHIDHKSWNHKTLDNCKEILFSEKPESIFYS